MRARSSCSASHLLVVCCLSRGLSSLSQSQNDSVLVRPSEFISDSPYIDQTEEEIMMKPDARQRTGEINELHSLTRILSLEDPTLVRCLSCNRYLSYYPITIDLDGDKYCGRCTDFVQRLRIRNILCEDLTKRVEFPCTFDVLGCEEKMQLGEMTIHEMTCQYGTSRCPVKGCCYESVYFEWHPDHFVTKHPALVSRNELIELPPKEDLPIAKVLIIHKQSVLLEIRSNPSNSSGKYELALWWLTKAPQRSHFKFYLKLTSVDNARSLNIDMPSLACYDPGFECLGKNVFSVDLTALQTVLESSRVSVDVQYVEGPTQSKSDNVSSVSLDCNICADSMKPPIYVCNIGHSICSSCRKRVSVCPSCKAEYAGARNFELEDLIEPKVTPLVNLSSTPNTELECPFKRCGSWKGRFLEFDSHLNTKHFRCSLLRFGENIRISFDKKRDWTFLAQFDNMTFLIGLGHLSKSMSSNDYNYLAYLVVEVSRTKKSKYSISLSDEAGDRLKPVNRFLFPRRVYVETEQVREFAAFLDSTYTVNLIISAKRI